MERENLKPAAYGEEYFGSGPDAAESGDDTSSWTAPLAGGAGALLLVWAVVLWRGRRARHDF